MVKIRVTIIKNVNIFIVYETLFENVKIILTITYQNKIKMSRKIGSAWFICKKFQIIINYRQVIWV